MPNQTWFLLMMVCRCPGKNCTFKLTTTKLMRKIFFATIFLLSISCLHAQTTNPGEEIIYGRKDGVALTMLELKPAANAKGKAIIRVIAGSWFSSYENAISKG